MQVPVISKKSCKEIQPTEKENCRLQKNREKASSLAIEMKKIELLEKYVEQDRQFKQKLLNAQKENLQNMEKFMVGFQEVMDKLCS